MNFYLPRDPLARLDYRQAFDLTEIYHEYKELMIHLGCAENIFDQDLKGVSSSHKASNFLMREGPLEELHFLERCKSFENKCFAHLRTRRRKTIQEPAREAMVYLALLGVAMIVLMAVEGTESYGGSFGIFAAIFNSIWFIRDIISSCMNLINTPPHALDPFEVKFVQNQCFIPKAIWSPITEEFLIARNNTYEQEKSLNFIRFSLGLMVHMPKTQLSIRRGRMQEIADDLSREITDFFKDYENFEDRRQLDSLKVNTRRFLGQLRGEAGQARYIHLRGGTGIGKTYFAKKISECISKIFPEGIGYEPLIINSPEELEGTEERPGAFLRILRNQC